MTPIESFLLDIKHQVNHKIQAGLPSEALKNVVAVIDKELRKLKGDST